MTDKIRCEIYVAMNEDGHFWIATNPEDAAAELIENEGATQVRTVKITVSMAPPPAIEVDCDAPDEAGATRAVEIEAA